MSTKTSNISLKWCMTGPTLLRRSNRKSHTRFQLVPKSVTLNDLERPKRTLAEKNRFMERNLNECTCRPKLTASGKM